MSPPHFCHISEIKSKQIYKTGAVGVPHEGPEEYNNIWQKTRANWRYVYEYYRDEFDYFHFGGDDLFVLVPNLKAYLASGPIKARNDRGEPLYLGRRFDNQGNKTNLFNFGGSGYTFNRKSLALLYDSFDEPFCRPHLRAPFEDVMVAECFRNGPAHLLPTDTRDKTGAERFHPFTPGQHLTWRPPRKRKANGQSVDWYENYNAPWGVGLGVDCCSEHSVSFHYVKPNLMPHVSALLFDCREGGAGGGGRGGALSAG